ncbi:MAG: 5-formyltetrahydrofolate cyclo-ligase [bacterium]
MLSLAAAKAALRVRMRAQRRELSACAWDAWSLAVCGRVALIEDVARAKTLLGYWPMAGEPDLRSLMQAGLDAGARWCLPAWQMEQQAYAPAIYHPGPAEVQWLKGAPQPARLTWVDHAATEVVCLPGLAFDLDGRRLGHGAGHYDRLLAAIDAARHKSGLAPAVKLGVTVEGLLVADVPAGETDVGMDGLITETRVIAISGRVRTLSAAAAREEAGCHGWHVCSG